MEALLPMLDTGGGSHIEHSGGMTCVHNMDVGP